MNTLIARLGLLMVGLCVSSALLADTGTLAYPMEDNLAMAEGTIEFWVQTPLDLQSVVSDGPYRGLLNLVEVQGSDGGFKMYLFSGASYTGTVGGFVSMGSRTVELTPFALGRFLPQSGVWHHLALTWRDRTMTFFLDGKQRTQKTSIGRFATAFGTAGEKPLFFGDVHGAGGMFVLDELRVSSVARSADELGFHGMLAADPYTRILDRFEEEFVPDGSTRTKPDILFAGEGGIPTKSCHFSAGKFGRGIALFRPAELQK